MNANPLRSGAQIGERIIPPSDPTERVRFWLERGDQKLAEAGITHLHWQWANGHYFLRERAETYRIAMAANPSLARAA